MYVSLELISVLGSQFAGDQSHKPDSRLPLFSARPVITAPPTSVEHHCLLACTILLYCLVTAWWPRQVC